MAITLQEAKRRASLLYLDRPGVFAVGAGVNNRGLPAIVITVSSTLPPDARQSLPLTIEGYPVVLIISEEPIPH
jgi:hypothetical protein